MKKVCFLLLGALATPLMMAAQAPATVAGKWTVAGEVVGNPVNETCTVTQDADGKLAGSCVSDMGTFTLTGTNTDKGVSWVHGGKYQGDDLVMTYSGKLGSDGSITGVIDVQPFGVTGSYSAKAAK